MREAGPNGKRGPHHAQRGQPSEQQPQDVEEEVKVDVVGDQQYQAVTEQTVTLEKHSK